MQLSQDIPWRSAERIAAEAEMYCYTNLTCDANLLTFRTLADFYQVPAFAIDVPWQPNEENVQYVADQLKELKIFLEKHTGKTISEDALKKPSCMQQADSGEL